MKNIVVYGKTLCPYCENAKMALDMCHKSYEYKLLDKDFKGADIKSVAPTATTYPVILINGEYIGGFEELMKVLL